MSISLSVATICFFACHGGPADHFATYAEALKQQGYEVQIHASGPALKRFQDRGIEVEFPFTLDNLTSEEEDRLANQIAKTCSTASLIITDLGHAFDVKLQKALAINAKKVCRIAYYDNFECFVPGGYSSQAKKVADEAEGVFFANEILAKAPIYSEIGKEVDFGTKLRIGIGYYPVDQAKKLAAKREQEHDKTRTEFLAQNGIKDRGQKVLVYFGGNNDEYFEKAFPAFLSFITSAAEKTNFENIVIVVQQHPGAKAKNLDALQISAWKSEHGTKAEMPQIVISNGTSEQAQVMADLALYYQTSMGPQFILAGIPTVQIGHETFKDLLIREGLALSLTKASQFASLIENIDQTLLEKPQGELVLKALGIREDWLDVLQRGIQECISVKQAKDLKGKKIGVSDEPPCSSMMYCINFLKGLCC